MNYLDKEDRIIDLFQDSAFQDAIFVGASRDALSVYGAVHNRTKWRNWTNSSGKSDPPPDYFSKTYGLMMDVMRTDDHTRLNKHGKAVNPTNQKEAQIQKELAENGFLDMFPHVDGVLVNAVTDLPSREDLFRHIDFDVWFDTVEQYMRWRFDAMVHIWMVLLAYGGKLEDKAPAVQVFNEYDSDELFDLRKLKNHRNYYVGLSTLNNQRTIHIFDKKTFWEVARA